MTSGSTSSSTREAGFRQIKLQGPELTPIEAAFLLEWQQARDAGRLADYDSKFEGTAELSASEWEGQDPQPLTCEEFEEVWDAARRQIAGRPARNGS